MNPSTLTPSGPRAPRPIARQLARVSCMVLVFALFATGCQTANSHTGGLPQGTPWHEFTSLRDFNSLSDASLDHLVDDARAACLEEIQWAAYMKTAVPRETPASRVSPDDEINAQITIGLIIVGKTSEVHDQWLTGGDPRWMLESFVSMYAIAWPKEVAKRRELSHVILKELYDIESPGPITLDAFIRTTGQTRAAAHSAASP